MHERDEVQIRANDKDRQLAELRKEVNNVIDKKKRLEQETERLKQHLVDVEDGYTQEALQTEEREQELRKKLQVCKNVLIDMILSQFLARLAPGLLEPLSCNCS